VMMESPNRLQVFVLASMTSDQTKPFDPNML
jgi:hypothetical protein